MATAKLYLDTRYSRKDETYPLKININHKGTIILIGLNLYLFKEQWDANLHVINNHSHKKFLNIYICKKLTDVRTAILNLDMNNRINSLSSKEVKSLIEDVIKLSSGTEQEDKQLFFIEYFSRTIEFKKKESTKETYRLTLNKIKSFNKEYELLKFEDINYTWLQTFEFFLSKTCSINTISIHMRNIRSVFNTAIDEELITCYPFRRFAIKSESTQKRSMSVSDLKKLRDYPCEPHQEQYRDIFMLIFYLIGINTIDLFNLKSSNLVGDRIEYRREKTGKLYSIMVVPEAMEIINRYRGKEYLLDIMERYDNYKDYCHRLNENLQSIGVVTYKDKKKKGRIYYIKEREPVFPQLTTYWARHTWATIAAGLDIPKETISEALGHEIGSKITSIYINFDQKKIDRANREIIDYINK